MAPTRLIVWKVSDWMPSKMNDHDYMRIAFKKYDGSKGTVYLNLTKNCEDAKWQQWVPYLKEGNVLDVTLQPNGNVNQFAPFRPIDIKPKNKE